MFETGQLVRLAGEIDPVTIDDAVSHGDEGWTLHVADAGGNRTVDLTDREAAEVEVLPGNGASPTQGPGPGQERLADHGVPALGGPGHDLGSEDTAQFGDERTPVESTAASAEEGSEPGRAAAGAPPSRRSRPRRSRRLWSIAILGLVIAGVVAAVVLATRPRERKVMDNFNVERPSLSGSRPTIGAPHTTWAVPSGSFAVTGGYAVAPDPGSTSIATIDVGSPVRSVRADLGAVANGAGIVFRYQDPSNYWSLSAGVPYGTWGISKTLGGFTSYVGNTGLTLDPAGGTVEVRLTDTLIKVLLGGKERQVVFDESLNRATKAGLYAYPTDAGTTRWRRFTVVGRP